MTETEKKVHDSLMGMKEIGYHPVDVAAVVFMFLGLAATIMGLDIVGGLLMGICNGCAMYRVATNLNNISSTNKLLKAYKDKYSK